MTVKDLPDYTREMVLRYTGGFIGLEELAVRLGFPGPWTLGGNVVVMDQFDTEETDWVITPTGTGASGARSTRQKFTGDWSLKMVVPDVSGAEVTCQRWLHFPGLGKYGLFTRIGWDEDCQKITLNAYFGDGSSTFQAYIDYNLTTKLLRLLHPTGPYANIATGLGLGESTHTFYPILLTVDLDTNKYDKLYFADVEYDISAYTLYPGSVSALPYSMIQVAAIRTGAGAFNAYLDAAIMLKNVP